MLSSYRLGAAAILAMGALTAGCAGPTTTSTAAAQAAGLPLMASVYDHDARFYAPRNFRSKCDDDSDATQRVACFEEEREEQLNTEDGRD